MQISDIRLLRASKLLRDKLLGRADCTVPEHACGIRMLLNACGHL